MKLAAWLCLAFTLVACGDDAADGMPDAGRDAALPDAGETDSGADAGGSAVDSGTDAGDAAPPAPKRICSADGFCWEAPTPQGETLHAAWAAAPDDVWAVGDHGTLLHYDGAEFRAEPPLTESDLLAIHGSSANDIWVAGDDGIVLHYDGESWSMEELGALIDASGGAMTGVLHGIYAAAPDKVWAVGHSGVAAVIIHYDGESWSNQGLSVMSPEILRAVWGTSPERVWAVGGAGTILAFDGTQWAAQMSPTRSTLSSIHGLTDHDVWAVGADRTAVHWDGMRWTVSNMGITSALHSVRVDIDTEPPMPVTAGMGAPPPPPTPDPMVDAGPPPAPEGPWLVWAFGEAGKVFRYNGTVWAELPNGSDLPIYGAARAAEGELFAVGAGGQITRFEADSRQNLSTGSRRNHLALWGDGELLWAVGDEIARRDDRGWQVMMRPSDRSLYGVWGDADGLWAVGTAGTVVHMAAEHMNIVDVPAAGTTWLRGVWGAGSSVWIVGHGGLAMVNAAGGFIAVDTKSRANLLDVWGNANNLFWAVGEGGTVLRWDGIAWLPIPTGPMGGVVQNLRAVWGSAADDVWVVGTESTILHWNGKRFENLSRMETYSLNDVWGRGPDEIYAVGTGGVALVYDGSEWSELATGTESSLQSVFGDDEGRVFAAGLDGVVLVREP